MAEVSNEPLYEVLKNLQARMSRFEQTHSEIKTELQAVRGHMLAHQTDIAKLYAISARQGTPSGTHRAPHRPRRRAHQLG